MNSKLKHKINVQRILWPRVLFFTTMHIAAAYGLLLLFTCKVMWSTIVYAFLLWLLSGMSITAGAHRLWAHRTYTACRSLRIVLMLCNCIAFQSDIISWAITHRCHHRCSDTDADPHNANRGFFYSHIGWILLDKLPERVKCEDAVAKDDLLSDNVLVFQKRHYKVLVLINCFILPTVIPWACWCEQVHIAFYICVCVRYLLMQHTTWTVNSLAHLYGTQPYDEHIKPKQNIISAVLTLGEGWHNYHHAFPYDYRASELPHLFDATTRLIQLFVWLNLASNVRTASDVVVKTRQKRCVATRM